MIKNSLLEMEIITFKFFFQFNMKFLSSERRGNEVNE